MSSQIPDNAIQKTNADLQRSSSDAVVKSTMQSERMVNAIVERNQTFLDRLFPTKIDKAKVSHELNLVKTEFEFRERVLRLIRETQIQSIQEIYNQYLAQGKAGIRQDTANFMLAKKEELTDQIQEKFDRLNEKIMDRWEKAENMRNPVVKALELKRIQEDLESFINLSNKLVKDFDNVASEYVKA